jgi:6-phosphofructokinase 1
MNALRGKLLVGQSGGCTPVINATLAGVVEQARRTAAVTAVWGMRHGIEGVFAREFVDLRRQPAGLMRRVARCPAAALGSCRRKLKAGEEAAVVDFFRAQDIRYFVYIGGNDSADTAHRLARAARAAAYDLRVVSAPKTIDNDLPLTDHTPGFGSTARFIAAVVADVGLDTEAMRGVEPVKIVEVMGRNAGWLAASAALAKREERDAPQFIWPPEVPFEEGKFLALVRHWLKRTGFCVAVVGETVRDGNGRPVAQRTGRIDVDAFGHPRTVGAGEYLCALVRERLGVRARWDKPGTIQRMSSAHFSETDLREARACGAWAVRFAARGRTDCMVVMRRRPGPAYRIEYDTAELSAIANTEKLLPDGWFDRKRMLPTAAFARYARPLVGAGLPEHPRLDGPPVPIAP